MDISNRKYLSKTVLACRERQANKLPKIPYTAMFIFERQKYLPYNPNLAYVDVRVFLVLNQCPLSRENNIQELPRFYWCIESFTLQNLILVQMIEKAFEACESCKCSFYCADYMQVVGGVFITVTRLISAQDSRYVWNSF